MVKKFRIVMIFIIIIIIGVLFLLKTKSEFNKIENRILDDDLGVTITYTQKAQLEELLKENQMFLEGLVNDIATDEELKQCFYINIPFDYPNEDIGFYRSGAGEDYKIDISDDLSDKFKYLSGTLKINAITISSDESKENVYLFYQSNCLDNTHLGVLCSPLDENVSNASTVNMAFIHDSAVKTFEIYKQINIDSDYFWYYEYSRDTNKYTFWDRLYDLYMKNL
jgi:hypothetical protein